MTLATPAITIRFVPIDPNDDLLILNDTYQGETPPWRIEKYGRTWDLQTVVFGPDGETVYYRERS